MTGPGQDEDCNWPGPTYESEHSQPVAPPQIKQFLPVPKFHHYIAPVVPVRFQVDS